MRCTARDHLGTQSNDIGDWATSREGRDRAKITPLVMVLDAACRGLGGSRREAVDWL